MVRRLNRANLSISRAWVCAELEIPDFPTIFLFFQIKKEKQPMKREKEREEERGGEERIGVRETLDIIRDRCSMLMT